MASQTMSPVVVTSDGTSGTDAWATPLNARISDDTRATNVAKNFGGTPHDEIVKIVKAGSITGDDQSDEQDLTSSDAVYSFGGTTDLWGTTFTPAQVNAANFGAVIQYVWNGGLTEYLNAQDFNFSIPTGSTITGIVLKVEARYFVEATSYTSPQVDHLTLTVYYTSTVQINATGEEFKSMTSMQINIGDVWKDVTKVEINIGNAWKTVF